MTKPFKTFQEQLEIIANRDYLIDNKKELEKYLKENNYYRFKKYSHVFRRESKVKTSRIISIHYFDQDIRSWIYKTINDIERYLRTQIAYTVSKEHSPISYIDKQIFSKGDYQRYRKEIQRILKKHFQITEINESNFADLPAFWEIIEYFNYGTLSIFYSDLNTQTAKAISQNTYKAPIHKIRSWIKTSAELRNKVAHYDLLYGQFFETMPASYSKEKHTETKLFSQIYTLYILYPKKDKWKEKVEELERIMNKYKDSIKLDHIGFPDNWKEKLLEPLDKQKQTNI